MIPHAALSLWSTVCPPVLPFLFIMSTHRQQKVESQPAADWPPSFIGPDKEPPLQSKAHQKSQPEHAKTENRVEAQIKHGWMRRAKQVHKNYAGKYSFDNLISYWRYDKNQMKSFQFSSKVYNSLYLTHWIFLVISNIKPYKLSD